jgi:hypothetical protein
MNNEDDIIDLILSGNLDSINQDIIDDYPSDMTSLNLETKNTNTTTDNVANSTPVPETIEVESNDKNEKPSDNAKEEKEIKNEEKKLVKQNLEKIEESKKIDEFFPQFKNPLDFVKYLEIDRVSANILKEMQNFLLENHRKKNNKYEVSEINSLLEINNEIADIDINLIFTKKDLLFIYTKKGNILIVSLKEQKFIKKLIPKNLKNTFINCLDATDDLQELICGYQDGTIAVINIQSGDTKYTNNKVHKDCPCIELKIYKKDKEKNELYFISVGGDGQVFYITIKMGIFWRLSNTPIIEKKGFPIFMVKYVLGFNLSEIYVLLGSLENISFFCIEPNIDQLFTITKPKYIKNSVVPDAQVGQGALPERMIYGKKDDNNNLLLIVSWKNVIYFYQLKTNNKNMISNYMEIGNYINKTNIFRIGFMNKSVIYCIDDTFCIKYLNSSKINTDKIELNKDTEEPIIPEKNYFIEISNNHFITKSFLFQKKIKDSKNEEKKTYLYSIIENGSSLFIFGESQIFKIYLMDWEVFLNNLKKKEDFINLFSVGIELYKGKFHALSNIPNNDILKKTVGDFLRQIISQYVVINAGEKKSGVIFFKEAEDITKIEECIKIAIESCIEIEAVEFLLNEIEPIFEQKEYSELFLEKFTPFVFSDKILHFVLSSSTVLNLIDLYYKNGKLEYLSQMLLHINIKSIDTIEIKNKLEKLNLTIPLIYLYMNGENQDYFIPLQKMFEIFNSKTKTANILIMSEENNSINYSNALNKKLITLKDILDCKEYAGHRILWYIRWILTGKKFPDEQHLIEKNIFENLVPRITYWLMNEKVIEEFLKFDPKYYFIIHKNIFSSKQYYDLLVNSANDPKKKITTLASLLTTVTKINDIQPSSLIDYIAAWCKKIDDKKVYFFLYDFIISISNTNNIKKELKIESAKFILNYYNDIVKTVNKFEIELLNRTIIDFLNYREIFSNSDYYNILKSIKYNGFDEVKLFLYKQLGAYEETINFYLDESSNLKNKKERLFEWINQKVDELKKTREYSDLMDAIKKNVLNLAKTSMNKFFDLSKKIFWKEKQEIIEKLSEDLNVQLVYVELLIGALLKYDEESKIMYIVEDDEEMIKYILIKHIYLLCELKKFDEIVPKLKENSFYPLQECLKFCEKYNAYDGTLYLYIKLGNIENAFNISTAQLNTVFTSLNRNINKDNNADEQKKLLILFDKYLNDTKTVCENEKNNDLAEESWFKVLNQLYRFEKESSQLLKKYDNDNEKKKLIKELYQTIIQDIKDLMEKMCSYVSIKRILDVVTEKNKNAGFQEFRELLIKILSNYDNLSSIFKSARNLLSNLILQNEGSFQILNSKGELLNIDKCDKCKKAFNKSLNNNKENILIFLCNHIFHRTCIKDIKTEFGKEPVCPICSELEISEVENKRDSLIRRNTTIIDKPIEKNQFQVNVSYSSKKMLKTLKHFDDKYFTKRKMLTD